MTVIILIYIIFHLSSDSPRLTNSRSLSGLRRRSPGPPHSQPQSQSSSELALSIGRTDSGRTNTTDLSEASTTEDYVTANTSTGTATAGTGTSATTGSWSRPGAHQLSSGGLPSAPASTTATAADGSSFESASSIYSLARSEVRVHFYEKDEKFITIVRIFFFLIMKMKVLRILYYIHIHFATYVFHLMMNRPSLKSP